MDTKTIVIGAAGLGVLLWFPKPQTVQAMPSEAIDAANARVPTPVSEPPPGTQTLTLPATATTPILSSAPATIAPAPTASKLVSALSVLTPKNKTALNARTLGGSRLSLLFKPAPKAPPPGSPKPATPFGLNIRIR